MTIAKTNEQDSIQAKCYRFDIFKGQKDAGGKVSKIRTVGVAYHTEGQVTYLVQLRTFLKDSFFLLPERKSTTADFLILTRVPANQFGKSFFWNTVGEAKVLDGVNRGLMRLSWDLFGGEDIYLDLYPRETFPNESKANA